MEMSYYDLFPVTELISIKQLEFTRGDKKSTVKEMEARKS